MHLEKGVCEIYFFRGGYGGLSFVENDRANHCFLIKAEVVREFANDAGKILENVIFQNRRARAMMREAVPVFDWLAVSVDGFGKKNLTPAENLLAVGDAAAFIDPFTGSGMLMALESAEILAQSISGNRSSAERIAAEYVRRHHRKFHRRLLICDILRRAAFVPKLAGATISILSLSRKSQEIIARATRKNSVKF